MEPPLIPKIQETCNACDPPRNEKLRSLRVRNYGVRLIDMNKYLASFPGANLDDKIGVTELNKILLNSMPTSWSKQAYTQGFDCESIYFKKSVNMFEHM